MPPFWKVKREINRVFRQTVLFFQANTGGLRRRYYDSFQRKKTRETQGQVPLGTEVAVFLIYQPDGISPSVITTLQHLKEQGISTVLVSNTAVSSSDLARAKKLCFQILERPNVGYDFGGYDSSGYGGYDSGGYGSGGYGLGQWQCWLG